MAVVRLALAPVWLVAFGILAPLFALLAVGMAVIASSRTNDPRAAQQLGAVVILPISALLSAQVFGFIRLDVMHAPCVWLRRCAGLASALASDRPLNRGWPLAPRSTDRDAWVRST